MIRYSISKSNLLRIKTMWRVQKKSIIPSRARKIKNLKTEAIKILKKDNLTVLFGPLGKILLTKSFCRQTSTFLRKIGKEGRSSRSMCWWARQLWQGHPTNAAATIKRWWSTIVPSAKSSNILMIYLRLKNLLRRMKPL